MLLLLSIAAAADLAITPELITEFPLMVGAGVRIETPGRIRLSTAIGTLPSPYLSVTNDLLVAAFPDDYSEQTATLIENTLSNSLLLRARLGWRPVPRSGWHLAAGGSLVTLAGTSTGSELLGGLTGVGLPGIGGGVLPMRATSTVAMVDVMTGWDLPFAQGFTIRPMLGWSFTVASKSTVEVEGAVPFYIRQSVVDTLEAESAAYLDDTLQTYVHPPWVGVAIGWRFGAPLF